MMWLNSYILHPVGAPCLFLTLPAWILYFSAPQKSNKVPQEG